MGKRFFDFSGPLTYVQYVSTNVMYNYVESPQWLTFDEDWILGTTIKQIRKRLDSKWTNATLENAAGNLLGRPLEKCQVMQHCPVICEKKPIFSGSLKS